VVQHDVGAGRVVTVLMGLDGTGNNWPSDPTFVIFLLRANAYLWSAATRPTSRAVEEAVEFALRDDEYARPVTFLAAVDEPPRIPVEEQAEPDEDGTLAIRFDPLAAAIEGSSDLESLLHPGISEYWLTRLDGQPEARLSAAVVAPREGDLRRAERGDIRLALQPTTVTFNDAGEMMAAEQTAGGGLMPVILLALLGMLLAGEQVLAYLASYHPPLRGAQG
jgi:hypothetical protein